MTKIFLPISLGFEAVTFHFSKTTMESKAASYSLGPISIFLLMLEYPLYEISFSYMVLSCPEMDGSSNPKSNLVTNVAKYLFWMPSIGHNTTSHATYALSKNESIYINPSTKTTYTTHS